MVCTNPLRSVPTLHGYMPEVPLSRLFFLPCFISGSRAFASFFDEGEGGASMITDWQFHDRPRGLISQQPPCSSSRLRNQAKGVPFWVS